MDNEINLDQWLTVRWEKLTDKGVRYYEVRIQQDLWGGWVLTKIWGRRGTQLGSMAHTPCQSYQTALDELDAVRTRRQRRGYNLVPCCA